MPHTRTLTRIAALAASVVLALLSLLPAPAARADDADGTGLDTFGGCVTSNGSGRVLLLVDQSRSLTESDAQNARGTAAKLLAKQLVSYSSSTGSTIEVSVAGFSDSYTRSLDWTTLNAASLDSVNSAITDTTARQDGTATDYQAALEGARGALGAQPNSCKMIAWFTDGELDFTASDRESRITAARTAICRQGGIADQLATAGIVNVAIGLSSSSGGESPDFGLLRSIAIGGDDCGTGDRTADGQFFEATNIDDLLFAFDRLGAPGDNREPTERTACVKTVCDEGKHYFVLDGSVDTVSVLADAGRPGLIPVLVSPDGAQTRLDPRTAKNVQIGGVDVDYSFPSEKSTSITMTGASAPSWSGVWALVFIAESKADAQTRSSIHITGGLKPALANAAAVSLHSGATDETVAFTINGKDGKPLSDAKLPDHFALDAELVTRDGKRTVPVAKNLDKNTLSKPQTVDLAGVDPGQATLRLTLNVTLQAKEKGTGKLRETELSPVRADIPVSIKAPVGYPTVADSISFGTIEGSGATTATIAVTGPGCVWLEQGGTAITASPDGTDIAVTSDHADQGDCLRLSDGESGELSVTLSSSESVNGIVGGDVVVIAAPKGDGDPVSIKVPFTGELSKPLNTGTFIGALIAALILGPLIPLLLLYFLKWLTARIPARALRVEQIPVRIVGGAVTRGNNQPFGVADTELVSLVPGTGNPTRSIDVGALSLRTRVGWSPFGAGSVVASISGMAGSACRDGATVGKTPNALLPLAIHNNWAIFHDPAGPEDTATVVLFVGGDAGRSEIDRIVGEVRDYAPRNLTKLRQASAPTPPAGGPSGGPPAPAPNPFGPTGGNGPAPFGPASGPPAGRTPPSGPQGNNPFGPGSNRPPGGNPFGPA
ncbi:hypothetical protein nbrc107696_11500 [Gordonia spumicola]|uniref:VWFA domain-containing protein n=1 Tax=Gordonia spumicola TaxID=589161 RepID=A0A7I9V662_9ACTN|nr:VWA domain-containing protein [Gordonia spumicola]GEE00704.1 hypothetical protein nbrc107696_11500 [Gordonia spumicola]